MSVNIACSAPDCTNPVIGQCTGYKKTCGKYYCREHSSDTLCFDCASKKAADDQAQAIYLDYVHTSEQIEKEVGSVSIRWESIQGWVFLMGISILILIISSATSQSQTSGLGCFGAIIFFASLFAMLATRNKHAREQEKIKAAEIEKSKPGFIEFFISWKDKKSKEQLMTALTVVGAIAAIGIAAAASESDYDRTRRAVRDEMNRN